MMVTYLERFAEPDCGGTPTTRADAGISGLSEIEPVRNTWHPKMGNQARGTCRPHEVVLDECLKVVILLLLIFSSLASLPQLHYF